MFLFNGAVRDILLPLFSCAKLVLVGFPKIFEFLTFVLSLKAILTQCPPGIFRNDLDMRNFVIYIINHL